jgi:hypothetical protein
MSTALWLYYREGETASTNQEDLVSLYRHASKLDRICRNLSLIPLSEFHDLTDAKFNMSNEALPDGISSTTELMTKRGSWHPVNDGLSSLSALLQWLSTNPTRFGVLGNDYQKILDELTICVKSLESRAESPCEFNLCVVQ